MIGTLNLPTVTPLRLSPESRPSFTGTLRSDRKMSFSRRIPCKAAVHAFADTATAPVETRRSSLYEVLRVKRNASATEIKTAYRSLAKLYHPDTAAAQSEEEASDGRNFIEIHNAYATLSDPAARALYDLSLAVGSGRRQFGYAGSCSGGFYPTRRWETDQCW
ncbi:chaperone protein dnaJ 11, chloroplastic-like [Actinidia eriantha]|uniref:chaperone protein dnaJ 11, chloroplastic-like n=1 Tax=Actinidia eriantha TaxID=165200 RepID=UPI002588E27A|nr:chaperone protein dnaJ 11, chloroplastic-like [Actinidia eriantha]